MNLQLVETLSLHEQMRLIEIAHETSSHEVREFALGILRSYLSPPSMIVPEALKND